MYQLFQPMCGVRARVSPQTILNFRSAWPKALLARNVTAYSPRSLIEPVIWPVCGSTFKPSGRPIDGKLHRPLAGGGDGEQEGMARPHAEDSGPVDPRRLRRLGREDHRLFAAAASIPRVAKGSHKEEYACQHEAKRYGGVEPLVGYA